MATVKHNIGEHDVVVLREQVGDWPTGTEGTAVSIYEDAALIELSGHPMEEALDNLVTMPADKLEVVWRSGDPPRRDMEA
ncbi:MAG TPA: hypothetical protein VMA77_12400 [Solirubrobacteraceae bacterium]|nr:hypothetical protein [Solirubrobacteraceae bacterium]